LGKPVPTAIHTDYFKDFRASFVAKEPTTTDEAIKEEQWIGDLSKTQGWPYLKNYIVGLTSFVDSLVRSAMEAGATREEIGERAITAEIVKKYLIQVIEKVENAKDASEHQSV